MATVHVTGAEQLAVLAGKMTRTEPKLRRRFLAGARVAVRPVIPKIKGPEGLGRLPSGLQPWLADSRFRVTTKTFGRTAGVRLVAQKTGHDIFRIDKGGLRHPVFGRRPWVNQSVPPGFFTEVVEDDRERMTRQMVAHMAQFEKYLL